MLDVPAEPGPVLEVAEPGPAEVELDPVSVCGGVEVPHPATTTSANPTTLRTERQTIPRDNNTQN